MSEITFGVTYKKRYLETDLGVLGETQNGNLITLKREKTDYGYRITQGTNFISIYKIKLIIFKNGCAKSVTKVEKNYRSIYQFTTYFDKLGKEIIDDDNNTRTELKYFKELNK